MTMDLPGAIKHATSSMKPLRALKLAAGQRRVEIHNGNARRIQLGGGQKSFRAQMRNAPVIDLPRSTRIPMPRIVASGALNFTSGQSSCVAQFRTAAGDQLPPRHSAAETHVTCAGWSS